MSNILSYETVSLDDRENALVILDQTRLPNEIVMLHLTDIEDIRQAIYTLQVRGAPAIGMGRRLGPNGPWDRRIVKDGYIVNYYRNKIWGKLDTEIRR